MKVHFIIHETYEGPGAFLNWTNKHGHSVSYTNAYLQETLPVDAQHIDFLIVLGGPQSPATTLEECHHFNAMKEIAFIRECIKAGKVVVGVCLGAQLIGEALGAEFEHSPHKEIGYFPIVLTEHGRQSDKLSHFKDVELVGHWHNDMPGLTPTSKVLASSEGCPRQVVQYSPLVYGFQCHLEFTSHSIKALIEESTADLIYNEHQEFMQTRQYIVTQNTLPMNRLLIDFMDKLMLSYQ
jgi:GMP synthase (glutamine-hydrolysing)